ncbi:kinesin family protein [Moniliophthora roreri MCA 2997]|uniref:Kinesin family protein n=2 Tax=Moniliophthora roreri TaxID=221103 RepID=V2XL21_MONRO|nr:kinesin family protein [Moniliophthora roreri MCA 2997]KAI3598508.1 kinesin family protein [Moniliophthora roreri]
MASRLPRLRSSSPTMPATASTSLKRKAIPEEDEEQDVSQPRKVAAVGTNGPIRPPKPPLQPSRTAANQSKSSSNGPKPLTKPRAPNLTTSRSGVRGTSAPPSQPSTSTRAGPSSKPLSTTSRNVSGPSRTAAGRSSDDRRFNDIQSKLNSMEAARAADAARVAAELDTERAKMVELQENQQLLSQQLAAAKDLELTRRAELNIASDEIDNLKKKHAREITDLELDLQKKDRLLRETSEDLRLCRSDLERERETVSSLKSTISHQSNAQLTLSTENHSLQVQNASLQAEIDAYSRKVAELNLKLESAEKTMAEMKAEATESESVRRKLHNMVQELKGNIRVFCRVRPVLPSDLPAPTDDFASAKADLQANMAFPDRRDHREIVLTSTSESATGQERIENYNFAFDRVFEPDSTQAEVFEEISMLAQSCIDGYNVCIFAYGQTGSGKSFTMEGGSSEVTQGMIPRAVEQVFRVSQDLKSKGWEYTMEGQFLEIYNETINDLLGKGDFDKKKHDIKHDPKTGSTRVTDLTVIPLQSPTQVRTLLAQAASRRSVAATLMNERSSRSHSVFTLRISGVNTRTGETCEGCLNLVDLAGSERINVSFGNSFGTGANAAGDKERLRETQSINRSLSALGDVIAALGEKGERGDKHIPYRNSKLTYLLQNSLSGNSKTLMVLNLSPLAAHLNESLTSLRFATKVNNTTIGTAKKQARSS